MKILKINNCAICPNKLWAGDKRICCINYKIIDVPVTDIPDWCPLEDVPVKPFKLGFCRKDATNTRERGVKVKRIYIAGAYSANNVISVLDNIRIGLRASTELFLKGYSVFAPWLDFHFQLMLREDEILSVEDYYRYSIDWLEVSDAVYVLPNSENSKGTQAEIKRAIELNIPVFYSMDEFPIKNEL